MSVKKSELYQILQLQAAGRSTNLDDAIRQNKEKLAVESERVQADLNDVAALQEALHKKSCELAALEKSRQEVARHASHLEKEDIQLQERRKQLRTKLKAKGKAASDLQRQKGTLESSLELLLGEHKTLQAHRDSLQQSLAVNGAELDKICESLKDVTAPFQTQLDARHAQLEPHQQALRVERQAYDLACSTLALLTEKEASVDTDQQRVAARIEHISRELEENTKTLTRTDKEIQAVKAQTASISKDHGTIEALRKTLTKDISALQTTLLEAKESLRHAASGSAALVALQTEAKMKRITGFHGRLGDLGTIDTKYDTAVSTACSFLDHLVVDTTEAGQACIEHLRRNNLGRASFILLDKMKPVQHAELPRHATRLFDLIKIKQEKYQSAFYFALGNTLVADSMDEATAWAYGAQRFRVVTLDGRLIETSGTISGGGRPARGGMRAALVANVSAAQISELEAMCEDKQNQLSAAKAKQADLQRLLEEYAQNVARLETSLLKLQAVGTSLPEELSDLQAQRQALSTRNKTDKNAAAKIKELQGTVQAKQHALDRIKADMAPVEKQIEAIQAQILDAGGIKYKTQRSKVDAIREQLEHTSMRLGKLEHERGQIQIKLVQLEASGAGGGVAEDLETEIAEVEKRLQELTKEALEAQKKMSACEPDMEELQREIQETKSGMENKVKSQKRFRKLELDLKTAIEMEEEELVANQRILKHAEGQLKTLVLHHIALNEPKPVLAVYEIDELKQMAKGLEQLKSAIHALEERLVQSRPNLNVLEEYRKRAEVLAGLEEELHVLDAERNLACARFEELRQKRHDQFMAGFRTISLKLKEMYQLITMGGNAELELVDSLDPFSEGILFSVMPPKKSWKNISNLSGGEKTLASLALVFALHTYKPTPIYVMDEIDAALDFRNVSIVANYIKKQTRDAQFLVISLRNNMFELADRLVGIYKVANRTNSVSIDPRLFAPLIGNS